MAKGLDLDVIAEGVETQEEVDFLKDNNCQFVQGYYYAKPMSLDEVMGFVQLNTFKFD